MKVLVTGGGGLVGLHTVDGLQEEGHEVVVIDNLDSQVHGQSDGYPVNLKRHANKG
ncbi:MAG: NAD-dependent epimerase/dehydratase family protein [Deltaproteobacteria bacterium]|nr:NAD-dependent epimerase/dehydratase family protein [Deltaproteobacteria bacterium]